MSTVGDFQYCRGYQDTCGDMMSTVGCSVLWMYSITKDDTPKILNAPTVLMISPQY